MRRARNPRNDDSVMLIGGLGLAALAYWYFTKHQSAAPAAHAQPALSPQNSTLAIPTVPASSTLATPVIKPFLVNPPSTLLPPSTIDWLNTPIFSAPATTPNAHIVTSVGEMIAVTGANVQSVGSGPLRCIVGQEPDCTVYAPQGTVLLDRNGLVDTVQ